MKKVVFCFILFAFTFLKSQVNVLESNLVMQNGLYYHNNIPFSGIALNYFPQEQIKSICEIKDGQKTGSFTSFFEDKTFKKSNYKDTAVIRTIENQIVKVKNDISMLISDTINSFGKMTDYLKDEIGGEKKLIKIKEKSAEGDLKGKKLEEFNVYNNLVYNHKLALQILKEKKLLLQNTESKLSSELAKKEFIGISKEQYVQKNGIMDGAYISHFENGKISSEGTFKNGKYNEKWTFFFENGNVKGKGSYKMGDGTDIGSTGISRNGREGIWNLFHENGKISQECNYENGRLTGVFKSYHKNGKVESEENYSNGILEGNCKYFYENGLLDNEGNYSNGKKNGEFKFYYKNGKLEQECNYVNGSYEGNFIYYHENGNLSKEGNYLNNKQNGLFKHFFESGILKSEVYLNDTLYNGLCKFYHENGKLKQEGNYINDLAEGVLKSYYNTGILEASESYKNDKREGPCLYYFENGKLKQEGNYTNDLTEGIIKFYYETGNLKAIESKKGGKRDGISKYYYEAGKLKQEVNFKGDLRDGLCKTYYDSGILSSSEFWKSEKREGLCSYYFENGRLEFEGNFKNNLAEGNFKFYNEEGSMINEVNYVNGQQVNNGGNNSLSTYSIKKQFEEGTAKILDRFLNGRTFPQSDYNKDYKCSYCQNTTIKGWKNGYNSKKQKFDPIYDGEYNKIYTPDGVRSLYPYCSPKCAKEDNE